ncbi:MAG TPA: MBL fold metallo-hydrolase, partial [Polyangiales bacterium]
MTRVKPAPDSAPGTQAVAAPPAVPTPEPTPVAQTVASAHAAYFAPPETDAQFRNPWPHRPVPGFLQVLRWKTQRNPLRGPDYETRPLSLPPDAYAEFMAAPRTSTRLFWIGHASFLAELDGVRVVIDPIFGRAGGLVRRVTPAALTPESLQNIDAVLVTH